MTREMSHDGDDLIDLDDAVDRMRTLRSTWLADRPTERVSLERSAGRVLAEPIRAPVDVPARSHATMDGFALDATDEYPLEVVDRSVFPEDDPGALADGAAVRIATGSPLPPSANAVLKREEATVDDGRLSGPALEPGTYVYERGSNVSEGEQLFDAGERLGAKDALLLGDLEIDDVTVFEPLSVGLLATGTEIHEGRHRDLDSPMLAGLVRSWGHEATYEGSVPDENDRVASRIDELASEHDVVLTTGGTSVGKKDYVVRSLNALGDVLFHRVRLRPGKPIAVARLPDHDAVAIAIPGKPVGAHLVTSLVARPFFTGDDALPTVSARLARAVDIATPGFTYAIPVTLEDGVAMPLGHVDSALPIYDETFDPSVLSSSTRASRADGIVLTEDAIRADERVAVVPHTVLER
ncbi:molybdopterin molybdotransferase MoeA [Natronorubrum sp. DTA7]|uniref:molybdopterin molybdotransferase MoeA n=1 Tax=Natronorubrum sp. DTA7 TaxID=3447016 RepID=UPI003F8370D2